MTVIKKDLSIKKLTLLIFLSIYSVFLIVTSINLYSYTRYEYSKTEKMIKNFNINISTQITQKINNVIDISKFPLIIPDTDKLNGILSINNTYNIEQYNYLVYLCDMMLIQNKTINGAYIFNLNGNGVYTSRNSTNDLLKNPFHETWFDNAINSNEQVQIFSNFQAKDVFRSTKNSDEKLIAVTRKIVDIQSQNTTGILLLTFSTDELLSLLTSDMPFNNQKVSLYDSDNNLIVSTNDEITEYDYSEFTAQYNTAPSLVYSKNNDKHIICYNNISSFNWTIINTMPKDDAYNIDILYIIFFLSNMIFCLILFTVIYLFFLNRVFNPIESLIENMSSKVETSLNYDFNYNKNDEIGILVNSYNDMKNRINNLITINYKNKIEQKELELKQLQNQINPHFIYNTLESIHMMAEINDDSETSTMAEYFGTIIRYSMNRRINTVRLKEELEIIDNYIYLQKMRFDTLFIIENLVSDDVLECKIIKMIIQPLIENSIYHGLSECDGNGKIIIQGLKADKNLIITVSDNGTGIDEEQLVLLNDYINDRNECFNGIALRNINKRLKLNYGEEYGLEVTSILGKGTSMILTLPYILS